MTSRRTIRQFDDAVFAVVIAWNVSERDVLGATRQRPIVQARQAAMLLLRLEGKSFVQISQLFNRHHATVIHACQKVRAFSNDDFDRFRRAARIFDSRIERREGALAEGS